MRESDARNRARNSNLLGEINAIAAAEVFIDMTVVISVVSFVLQTFTSKSD